MKKTTVTTLLLTLGAALFVSSLYILGFLDGLEFRSVDMRFRHQPLRDPHPDLVVVDIDEHSIEELGRWPWTRDVHGRLIKYLSQAGAKAIAFDVLFTEVDKDHPGADRALGEAAAKSGRTVFGMLFQERDQDESLTTPKFPIETLRRSNIGVGAVNIEADADGINRKLPIWLPSGDKKIPGLPLAALATAEKKSVDDLLQELKLPTEGPRHELRLNFMGDRVFPWLSFTDVLNDRWPRDSYKDKIILVGGSATGLFDFTAVPNIKNFAGLEVHATLLDNLLNRNYLRTLPGWWTLGLIFLFSVLSALLLSRLSAWVGAFSTVLSVAGYYALCQVLFNNQFLQLDFVAPVFTLLLTYFVVLSHRLFMEQREKRWIKGTFSQYLSPKVIEVITADPSRLKLGGEEREMTVFFSDLAGFTSISEALKPSELVQVLNEYLTDMSDIIFKYEGVVDKYIGDAIMAFWNAPVNQANHPTLACMAALEQIEKLAELQKRFRERGLPLIDCRIGVNTGTMVVGNMGSKARFDYTVMGDSVNLASRLEGANKPFHTHIMISEFTYEKVKDDVEARQLDLLRVKGKAIPLKVYELAARKGALSPEKKQAFALYEEGLALYRDRKFTQALEKFKQVQSIMPDDGPSQVYMERSQGYVAAPPPPSWDGVYVMTTK